MKTCTMGDFLAGRMAEDDECIYAVFDGSKCLYVGLTRGSIFDRWYSRLGGHVVLDRKDNVIGLSNIGKAIEDNAPDSLMWQMKTFSIEDCVPEIEKIFPSRKHYSINDAELAMIKKFNPSLNQTDW